MRTEVKMKVTPDLSERVQEIVILNGGGWHEQDEKIMFTEEPYLNISNDKRLSYNANKIHFQNNSFKEISAYDFIASQGEQEWLPRYNEEVLFSKDRKNWFIEKFVGYIPNSSVSFMSDTGIYQYCSPFHKKISFIQFLKDSNAYEAYMENSKIENQRWSKLKDCRTLIEIKSLNKNSWVSKAFAWYLQKEGSSYWKGIHDIWKVICKNNNKVVWE